MISICTCRSTPISLLELPGIAGNDASYKLARYLQSTGNADGSAELQLWSTLHPVLPSDSRKVTFHLSDSPPNNPEDMSITTRRINLRPETNLLADPSGPTLRVPSSPNLVDPSGPTISGLTIQEDDPPPLGGHTYKWPTPDLCLSFVAAFPKWEPLGISDYYFHVSLSVPKEMVLLSFFFRDEAKFRK